LDAGSRACVYTTLIGRYEQLNEQPLAAQSRLPFICLTDEPELRSESWDCRLVSPVFPRDPVRSQRDLKIRPHVHLPEFHRSVYIDNSVVLTQPPERLLDLITDSDVFVVPEHSYRDTVLDEFLEVSRIGLDDNTRIFEQLNHYTITDPEVLAERPYWDAILVRDHDSAQVRSASEIWAAHVMRYSRRDQLSIHTACRAAGLRPTVLRIDNYQSEFHRWPVLHRRDTERGARKLTVSLMTAGARIRDLECQLAKREEKIAELSAELVAFRTANEALSNEVEARRAEADTLRTDADSHRAEAETLRAELVLMFAEAESQHSIHAAEEQALLAELERGSIDAARDADRIAHLTTKVAELSVHRDAMLASTTWGVTAPLRWLGRRLPKIATLMLRRAFRLTFRSRSPVASGPPPSRQSLSYPGRP